MIHRDMYVLGSSDGGATFAGWIVQPWGIDACPMTSLSPIDAGARTLAAWRPPARCSTARSIAPRAGSAGSWRPPGSRSAANIRASRRRPPGPLLMVWTEKTGWERGGTVAWQFFDGTAPAGAAGSAPELPVWSFAAAVARPDGGFLVLY